MPDDALSVAAPVPLGPDSVILLVNTEGATDPENYQRIIDSF